jgi:hypothetical protein
MSDEAGEGQAYTGWAVVELLGRRRYAGHVSEVVQFGVAMGRLDVPETDAAPAQTIFFGGDSVYQLSPVSEEAARAVCQYSRPEPVHRYELTPPTAARALDAPRDPFMGRSSDIDPAYLGDADDEYDDDEPPL